MNNDMNDDMNMNLNLESITSVKKAEQLMEQLIKKINSRIQYITENKRFVELEMLGLKNKLSFSEILEINKDDEYYLVIPKCYPHQGSIIKVKIEKIIKVDCNYKVSTKIYCKSIKNDVSDNKLDNWIFPIRTNLNYLVQVESRFGNETVDLDEPHILTNNSSLWKAEFYKLNTCNSSS